jgi:hypothetical protein
MRRCTQVEGRWTSGEIRTASIHTFKDGPAVTRLTTVRCSTCTFPWEDSRTEFVSLTTGPITGTGTFESRLLADCYLFGVGMAFSPTPNFHLGEFASLSALRSQPRPDSIFLMLSIYSADNGMSADLCRGSAAGVSGEGPRIGIVARPGLGGATVSGSTTRGDAASGVLIVTSEANPATGGGRLPWRRQGPAAAAGSSDAPEAAAPEGKSHYAPAQQCPDGQDSGFNPRAPPSDQCSSVGPRPVLPSPALPAWTVPCRGAAAGGVPTRVMTGGPTASDPMGSVPLPPPVTNVGGILDGGSCNGQGIDLRARQWRGKRTIR